MASARDIALVIARLLIGFLIGVGIGYGLVAQMLHAPVGYTLMSYAGSALLFGASMLAGRLIHADNKPALAAGIAEIFVGIGFGIGLFLLLIGIPAISPYY